MNPHQILVVVIRFAALIWILYSLAHSYSLFVFANGPEPGQQVSVFMHKPAVAVFVLLKLLVGVVLWKFPSAIARSLLPEYVASPSTEPASSAQWQTFGFVLIGIWALSSALPDALYWFKMYAALKSHGGSFSNFNAEQTAGVFATVAEIVIGFLLVFGAKGFSGFVSTIRNAGQRS